MYGSKTVSPINLHNQTRFDDIDYFFELDPKPPLVSLLAHITLKAAYAVGDNAPWGIATFGAIIVLVESPCSREPGSSSDTT